MSTTGFYELAAQFCAAIESPVPELTPDGDGVLSFSAVVRDVHVAAAHDPLTHPGLVLVYATFGPVPVERELQVLRALLQANLLMTRPAAPTFTRNPDDGLVILRYACPLSELTGSALWDSLQAVIDSALQWREDYFLGPDAHQPLPATSTWYPHAHHPLS